MLFYPLMVGILLATVFSMKIPVHLLATKQKLQAPSQLYLDLLSNSGKFRQEFISPAPDFPNRLSVSPAVSNPMIWNNSLYAPPPPPASNEAPYIDKELRLVSTKVGRNVSFKQWCEIGAVQ